MGDEGPHMLPAVGIAKAQAFLTRLMLV